MLLPCQPNLTRICWHFYKIKLDKRRTPKTVFSPSTLSPHLALWQQTAFLLPHYNIIPIFTPVLYFISNLRFPDNTGINKEPCENHGLSRNCK
jgi:hypothetical protein